ncbi:arrestin [Xylariomycetidae sp. FL0641]|nr:arrestin [Xylariomycetidae sp. FL0641]
MGSNIDDVAGLSLDDNPRRRSFFARLASPLRTRTRRNPADFHIRLHEPHRHYSAGDRVKGHVILCVVKPIRVTHLTVALHGYVRVYKNASAAAQLGTVNPAVIAHGGNKNIKYHGNGHASLFQDEQVLCGEERLRPMRYEYEFELIFPSKPLPSSIDFERGTISYMVTATLTRPTSIAPTTSCETKLNLVEKMDIALIAPPRERKVTMQTLRKRPKRRKTTASAKSASVKRSTAAAEASEPTSDRDSTRANENSNESSVNFGEAVSVNGMSATNPPNSPRPLDGHSEVSGESATGSNYSGSVAGRGPTASAESVTASRASRHDEREITATVEVLKGGYLPGDLLPVKIRVEHNRRMKSMHGIIVTLYRQGRVDYAPPVSHFAGISEEDAKKLEREEYYPKSRTGLGGLSLSSAGSCSVFRKDLSQAVAPLIIDPATLTANVTAAVRVPEDVFPSIKGVPGGLISFKYHVEVVVDLGGKLAGPSAGSSQPPAWKGSVSMPAGQPGTFNMDVQRLANWNGTIVDTDHLRREKGVISVSFEVVVGTLDSLRSNGKAISRPTLTVQPPSQDAAAPEEDALGYGWSQNYNDQNDYIGEYDASLAQSPESYFPTVASPASYYGLSHETQAPEYIPSPEVSAENGLSEKERVRRAEQRLLPSQPTLYGAESEAGPSQPSAPRGNEMPAIAEGDSLETVRTISRSGPQHTQEEEPSAPALEDLAPSASSAPFAPSESRVDDKQELERQRLMQEASGPPEVPEDFDGSQPSAPPLAVAGPSGSHEPSAPMLDEDGGNHGAIDPYHDIAGPSNLNDGAEPLPRYER